MIARNSLLLCVSLFLTLLLVSFMVPPVVAASSASFRQRGQEARTMEPTKYPYDKKLRGGSEEKALRREQEWADMEMARYEKAHGFLAVGMYRQRLADASNTFEQLTPPLVQEEARYTSGSNLRGLSENEKLKRDISPF